MGYLLRGLLSCGICGRKLQGSARPSRTQAAPARVLYRCEFGASRSIPTDFDHPPIVYVREDAIVPKLDAWLAEIVTPEALAQAHVPPPETAARDAAARAALADCDRRIERLLASIEKGIEADVVAPRVLAIRAERARIEASLPERRQSRPLSPSEITAIAQALGGLIGVLEGASPEDRAEVYRQLGVNLAYDPALRQVGATADLPRVGVRVEGGT